MILLDIGGYVRIQNKESRKTKPGDIDRFTDQLSVNHSTLYSCVKQAQKHPKHHTDATSRVNDAERISELKRENFKLQCANTILKRASVFARQS